MEVKKQKLLCFLQPTPSDIVDVEEKESIAALSTFGEETVKEKEEEEDDLIGMRCSAPLKEVITIIKLVHQNNNTHAL